MKRLCTVFLVFLCTVSCLLPLTAHADELYDDTLQSILSLAEDTDYLPDSTDPESLTGFDIGELFGKIWNTLQSECHAPAQHLGLLMGIILTASLVQGFRQGGETSQICEVIGTLCAVTLIVPPLDAVFQRSAAMLSRTSDFMLGFTGIFGAVTAVSGNAASAGVWQGGMILLCEAALEVTAKILLPLLELCMAMCISDAVNPEISLQGFITAVRKFTTWALGLMMAVFLGILSVQTTVTAAADHAGTKAVRYMISGGVPIVGGAVSDAYAAVMGSMDVLRSCTGMTGILLVLSLLMPSVLSLGLYRLMLQFAAAAAELFAVPTLTRLFKDLAETITAAFSIAVSFGVMFIFATAVLMKAGGV